VLLCVLEQPRVDNSNMGAQLEAIGPIGLRATLQLVKQAKNRRK